jgi:hypothetical protein
MKSSLTTHKLAFRQPIISPGSFLRFYAWFGLAEQLSEHEFHASEPNHAIASSIVVARDSPRDGHSCSRPRGKHRLYHLLSAYTHVKNEKYTTDEFCGEKKLCRFLHTIYTFYSKLDVCSLQPDKQGNNQSVNNRANLLCIPMLKHNKVQACDPFPSSKSSLYRRNTSKQENKHNLPR